jgi:hypothetical protein
VSAVDTSRPDGIARRPHSRHCHSVRWLRQHAVRRTPSSGQPPASRFCCCRGHRLRRLASTAVAGGAAWTVGCRRPPYPLSCSGGCGRVRGGERPSGQHWPQSRTHSGHCRGVRFRGHPLGSGPGRRSRQTSAVRRCGQWTRPADTRNPQAAATVDTRDCGMGTRTLRQRPAGQRQRNRPLPLACPAGNGTCKPLSTAALTASAPPGTCRTRSCATAGFPYDRTVNQFPRTSFSSITTCPSPRTQVPTTSAAFLCGRTRLRGVEMVGCLVGADE